MKKFSESKTFDTFLVHDATDILKEMIMDSKNQNFELLQETDSELSLIYKFIFYLSLIVIFMTILTQLI